MTKSEFMANDLRDLGWTVDVHNVPWLKRYHAHREETPVRFAWDDNAPIYVVLYAEDIGSVLTSHIADAVALFRTYLAVADPEGLRL